MAVGEAVRNAGQSENPEKAAPSVMDSETGTETTGDTSASSESYRDTGASFENYQAALSECTRRVSCREMTPG